MAKGWRMWKGVFYAEPATKEPKKVECHKSQVVTSSEVLTEGGKGSGVAQ